MDTPHPRIDERFCRTLLLLLLLLRCCRVVDRRHGRITGARRGRAGALVGLGQRRTAARWRRQWRRQRWRGLFVDERRAGRRQRHGSGWRRSMCQGRRGRVVVRAQTVVQRRRRLELQSAGRISHRRRRIGEAAVLMENRSGAVAAEKLVVHAERGDVRRRSGGRIHGRVVVGVRAVHDVISGRRVRRHGGRSEVLARDGVGRRRLSHAGVDEVRAHCIDRQTRQSADVWQSMASRSRHAAAAATMM